MTNRKRANPRATTAIDRRIGVLIRQRRKAIAMSQEELAEKIGVTFQQIQKYENARNRVAASRLYQIAQVVDAPISSFFEA